ncbi:MAG: DNA methyltransferase [Gammaproteobacteria bacterium]|nr:DNA methyltransferase [Gammaproteobacteria bacterium]
MKPNIQSRTVFLGDNLDFLRGINSECVDLIYADPPFNKKKEFTAPIGSAAEGAGFLDLFAKEDIKDEWVEEFRQENYELHSFLTGIKAIGNSYNYCYLVYMAIRIIECHRILKNTGSFYLHCDHTMSHYLKMLLDCIFGEKQFRNEIVWEYDKFLSSRKKFFNKNNDVILFYAKGRKNTFNTQFEDRQTTHSARGYVPQSFCNEIVIYEETDKNRDKIQSYIDKGYKAKYVNFRGVPYAQVWSIPKVGRSKESTGYPTQKPLALLERIVAASSNKGDWVLDPFCGCVTTCIAAEKLQRHWAGIDVAEESWNQIKRRLKKEVPSELFDGKPNLTTTPPIRGKADARPRKYVYVISNPAYPGMYKVGVAANAEARLNQFQTGDPKRRYQLEYKKMTPEYKTLEPYIHRQFDGDHEWVPGALADIIAAIKNYRPARGGN